MTCILLVDDEPAITESLAYAFERVGIKSLSASCLSDATRLFESELIDLIVLDLVLPDGNGLDWLKKIRAYSQIPVIILSSHDETVDQVVGLEVGADDYVGKPFSPRAMIARVRAVLRRTETTGVSVTNGVRIDTNRRQAYLDEQALPLSRTEFDLLHLFLNDPGRVFERDDILTAVWGPDVSVTERTVDVHIKSLRKKLAAAGQVSGLIETVRGVGYRLAETAN
ncbi:MAG: response regulator transcription factor [Myxococcota bacterium]|nr:response regulator transcription factor [Myxococcota bacterium]